MRLRRTPDDLKMMVDSWPMMGSSGPMLCIVGIYLAFVLKVGPNMMEKRRAFQLKSVLIVYNALQVLISIWLTAMQILNPSVMRIILLPKCDVSTRSPSDILDQIAVTKMVWWYLMAKFIELLDTVFFVLRKRQDQVTFLHVYHHSSMVAFTWCYLKYSLGEQGAVIMFLNSFVHIIMYLYYMIAALGPQYKKYIWWKKYMTTIQLTQFVMMLGYMVALILMDCKLSKTLTWLLMSNVTIFLCLFSDFYRKAYTKKQV